MTVTDTLVEFITAGLPPEPDVLRIVDVCLLDWASVTCAGKDEPVSQLVRNRAMAEGGTAEAQVCGASQRLPARTSAMVNGVTSHALDYDDTHFASLGHPSVTVIPAVVALADRTGASMAEVKQAVLTGAEVAIRLGVWLGRDHYRTGFHVTGTAGTFGAVAGAAHLLQLTKAQTRMALGVAASLAGGVKAQFGTMAKPMHAGLAAAAGVDAVLWAQAGLVAAEEGLDAPQGYAATHHAMRNNNAFDGLGRHSVLPEISHKFHACCHGTHAMLEALGALRDAHRLTLENVSTVKITVHPQYLDICNIPEPGTGLEAKFSYRHLAAMMLGGVATERLESFGDATQTDPDLSAFRARVSVRTDTALGETYARVEIERRGGGHLIGEHDLSAPMTFAEREARILVKSAALIGASRSRELWSDITSFTLDPATPPGAVLLAI